jgi:hypothetical protein
VLSLACFEPSKNIRESISTGEHLFRRFSKYTKQMSYSVFFVANPVNETRELLLGTGLLSPTLMAITKKW